MGILSGKVAIVTGASSGVGYGIALRFAMEGAKVVACARRLENLESLRAVAEERGYEGVILPCKCDIGQEADMDRAVKTAIDNYGTVHILANIAQGGLHKLKNIMDTTVDECMELYLQGPVASMLMMQKCFPYMKEQGFGRIINCSTPSVIEGTPGQTAYVMSKGGVDALTRAASQEWGPYGITTNNFLPTIKTENFDKSDRGRAYAKKMAEENPVRYFGTPFEDCAPMIAFLCSDQAGYINGQAIGIDGERVLNY